MPSLGKHLSSVVTPLCHFREHLGSYLVFDTFGVAHRFSFLLCVVFLCFVCLRLVSCVSNVTSVSGLAILDCSFGIL